MNTPVATLDSVRQLLATAIPSRPPHGFAFLATVDAANVARVRTMTLRGYDRVHDHLWTTSHVDSQKVQHLRQQPQAEICLWLPEHAIQFRLIAFWSIIDATTPDSAMRTLHQTAWDAQPPESRALYAPTPPGAVPEPFAVILGTIHTIDALHISPTAFAHFQHQRTSNGWTSQKMAR